MRSLSIAALAAFVASVGLSATASAADILPLKAPAPAVARNWTGFYAGANAGAAWSHSNYGLSTPAGPGGGGFLPPFFVPGDSAAIGANGSGSLSSTDFTGGLQAGYNYQISKAVVGVEADVNAWTLSQRSAVIAPTPAAGTQTTNTSTDATYLITLRGRLGYLWTPSLLVYATGGAALANLNYKQTISFAGGIPTADSVSSARHWGWVVGGGAEYAVDAHWSVKAEYLYLGFGSQSFESTAVSPWGAPFTVPFDHTVDFRVQVARAGLNYKF